MKRIVLVRHAKAEDGNYSDDLNRKLRSQGKEDARMISIALKGELINPDLIISSHARRALKTAKMYAKILRYHKEQIQIMEELYDGISPGNFIDYVREFDDSLNTVFVFGHNPTIYYLVSALLHSYNQDMPTCATIGIDFAIDTWKDIELMNGTLAFRLTPHLYK